LAAHQEKSAVRIADHVESVVRNKILFLSRNPAAGQWRKNLTGEPVRFFPVYSYLIVYRPETTPLQIVAILHGRRDVEQLLREQAETQTS
jgi:antitoxin ParD1/3/4/toxin ParE1/3/4